MRWLSWLASTMKRHSQTVFYLGWMQPSWLVGRFERFCFRVEVGVLCWLATGLSLGLLFTLLFALNDGLRHGLSDPLSVGMVLGLIVGLIFGIVTALKENASIRPVEAVTLSWKRMKDSFRSELRPGLQVGLVIGPIGGLIDGMRYGLGDDLLLGLIKVLTRGLIGGLVEGLLIVVCAGLSEGFLISEIAVRTFPNEEIKRSAQKGFHGLLITWLSTLILLMVVVGMTVELLAGLIVGVIVGLIIGLIVGLYFGGLAVLQHCSLRLILCFKKHAPLNYVWFLDHAAELLFLRKVGGGYIFLHRMLMEYFASLDEHVKERRGDVEAPVPQVETS